MRAAIEGDVITSGRRTATAQAEGPRAAWSRRRFMTQGLLTMAAAAPALGRAAVSAGNSPVLSASNETIRAAGAADALGAVTSTGSGAIRSVTSGVDRLTTDVYINDTGPYRFLVDTGAERTLIAAEIAEQLALPRGRRVLVEGIIRGQPAALAKIATLKMGTLICPPLEVPVLPRSMLRVDGYLGLDVLDRHRVVLDFRGGTLTVDRSQGLLAAFWERVGQAVVDTLGSSGRLRATDCLVNGVRAAAFVDTGAEVSVINPALYAQLLRDSPYRQVARGPAKLHGVTGGTMVGLDVDVEDIKLAALHWTDAPFVVAPLEVFEVWGLARRPALLLGMDCLRRFARVSIDYGRKQIGFEVASSQIVQPLQAGLSPPRMG